MLVDGADPPVFDHLTQLFDVDQALAFALPLLLEFAEGSQRIEEKIDVAVIGAGGMYIIYLFCSILFYFALYTCFCRRIYGSFKPKLLQR